MSELDKLALQNMARAIMDTHLPRVESEKARDVRLMVRTKLIRLAAEIEKAITEGK